MKLDLFCDCKPNREQSLHLIEKRLIEGEIASLVFGCSYCGRTVIMDIDV